MSVTYATGTERSVFVSAAAALTLLFAPAAWAAPRAGEAIVNTATAAFAIDGTPTTVTSNTTSTQLVEVLDLTLTAKVSGTVAIPADGAVAFTLTNTGNGNEVFRVSAAAPGQDGGLTIAIDGDGNGTFDAAVDTVLPADGTTPVLAPGASLPLLLRFAKVPTGEGTVTITAKALTGSGTPGTTFTGAGDQGGDAVVGRTRAEASLPIAYRGSSGDDAPATLAKSQVVRAPDGSATPIQGATITYRLALTTATTSMMTDAEIVDPIPPGTAFVPGSIQIEDAAASDVADADAAYFDGQAIHIALGEISQPTTRVVTFQVTIL